MRMSPGMQYQLRENSAPETISRDRRGQSGSALLFGRQNAPHDLTVTYDLGGRLNEHRCLGDEPHLNRGVYSDQVFGFEQHAGFADVLDPAFVPRVGAARTIADRQANVGAVCSLRVEGPNIAGTLVHYSGDPLKSSPTPSCVPPGPHK